MGNAADVQPMEAACLIAAASGHDLRSESATITAAVEALRRRGLLDAANKLTQTGRLCTTTLTAISQREIARFSGNGQPAQSRD